MPTVLDLNRLAAFARYADDIGRINEIAHDETKEVATFYGKRARSADYTRIARKQAEESNAALARFRVAVSSS